MITLVVRGVVPVVGIEGGINGGGVEATGGCFGLAPVSVRGTTAGVEVAVVLTIGGVGVRVGS